MQNHDLEFRTGLFPDPREFSDFEVVDYPKFACSIAFSTTPIFQICQENDKDVKLQPCAHLLCSECLFQWQEHDKSSSLTCPFCRAQVKDYEHVEVDPFQ